jgi:hypothetical protein
VQVSWLRLKTKVDGLSVVWSQNQWDGFSLIRASIPMAMVCEWFGRKTTQMVFTGLASKPVATVSSGLASKPATTVSCDLASKPATTVSAGLASKSDVTVFSDLASKLVVTVFSSLASKLVATVSPGLASKPAFGFLVEPQKQGGGEFSGLSLKTDSSGFMSWASKSP